MRSIVAAAVLAAVPLLSLDAQCVTSADVPVAEVRYKPTCGHAIAKIAANADGALALWLNTHAGFGMITSWMSGTTLDREGRPRRLAEHMYAGATAEVATDGHDYLIATTGGGSLAGRIVHADGRAEDAVALLATGASAAPPRVAWNGRAYVVASGTRLLLVSATGRLLDSAGIDAQPIALVAVDDNRVLAITPSMQAVMIDALVAGAPKQLPILANPAEVSVARGADGFIVVWRSGDDVFARRFDLSGTPREEPRAVASRTMHATVVAETNDYLVLWDDAGGVEGARIRDAGAISPAFRVATGTLGAAAFNGIGTVVLSRTTCLSIASTFVTGGTTSPTVDVSLAAIGQGAPQIVTTSAGHQIFWMEGAAVMTAFVSSNGTIGAAEVVNDPADITRYVVARVADTTYVIWSDFRTVHAARYDGLGHRIDRFDVASGNFIFGLAAASNRTDSITIAWTDQREGITSVFDVMAARVAGGAVIVPPTLISSPADRMFEVVAAADRDSSFIAWRNDVATLVSVKLDGDLRPLLRREFLAPTTGAAFPIAAALHGSSDLVVWSSSEADGIGRLHATVNLGTDMVLRTSRGAIMVPNIEATSEDWIIDSAAYADDYATVTIQRDDRPFNLTFGKRGDLGCAPGELDFTTERERVDYVLYAAPQAENEGAPRVFLRRVMPGRRHAIH